MEVAGEGQNEGRYLHHPAQAHILVYPQDGVLFRKNKSSNKNLLNISSHTIPCLSRITPEIVLVFIFV